MYISRFEIIEDWHFKTRLEENEDVIITTVVNKKLKGNWIMKLKCISYFEEISAIKKYLTCCENAVSIPKNCIWHGVDTERKFRWYVMQQYDGDISKKSLFTKSHIQIFLKDIITFLKHIHSQGAVHGDLKLKNILYTAEPVKFFVCDYEFLKSVEDNRKESSDFESYVNYYYSYLGIPKGKPKFGYRSDLTIFGYILLSIIVSEKETFTQFKWQKQAIDFYNIKEKEDYLFSIDIQREIACNEMPAGIMKYFTYLEKISWTNETPPATEFYDELAEMRLE